LYRSGVGNKHDDEWDEEGDERGVDGKRPVKDTAGPRDVVRDNEHVTCIAIASPPSQLNTVKFSM